MKIKNPVLNYYGGKFSIAKWIISHFPANHHYNTFCEPYTGAASVSMIMEPAPHHYINDLDNRLINFFRTVRDNGDELREKLFYTPYSREEYIRSLIPSSDPLEDARRLFITLNQGRKGSLTTTERQWKRSKSSGTGVPNSFCNKVDQLTLFCDKLRRFYIESTPALDLIRDLDSDRTLFYIDPPYLKETRTNKNIYSAEMTEQDHISLLNVIKNLSAFVVISGYDTDLYNQSLEGWTKDYRKVKTFGDPSNSKIEIIWMNYNPEEFKKMGRIL